MMGHILSISKISAPGCSRPTASITVTDVSSLVTQVSNLLMDEDYRLWYGRHAVEVLHQNQGALSRLLQLLQPYLPQRSH
uniref:CAZy families GT30 protein n=1 Tax=uncultured Klebsiella sp. TaxID=284011 RepID=A0A060CCE4_9ENTR|nr:CAZy families GT30 protein [uncultured Klebsiella sp.]